MFHNILISPGKVVEVFADDDARLIIQKWIDIFARNRKGCCIKNFKWYIFSGGYYESEDGDDALSAYSKHIADRYFVINNSEALVFVTDIRPNRVSLSDYYICPPNMAWTMAFTHEDDWLGPYFAKHPDYKILELENQRYRRKLKEIEEAKCKGWC